MNNHNFFARKTLVVARDLLGMELVRTVRGKKIRCMIIETEAYHGFHDKASHASRGETLRNKPMFDSPGTIYVYLIYGMHYCLNLVTEAEKYPAAVLVRGIELLDTKEKITGPGRVTKALRIDKSLNAKKLSPSSGLALGRRIATPKRIIRTPRVGVDYAGEYADKRWRFIIE